MEQVQVGMTDEEVRVRALERNYADAVVDRGTGRKPLADYRPNETIPSLDKLPGVFASAGWMSQAAAE